MNGLRNVDLIHSNIDYIYILILTGVYISTFDEPHRGLNHRLRNVCTFKYFNVWVCIPASLMAMAKTIMHSRGYVCPCTCTCRRVHTCVRALVRRNLF